MENGIIEKAVTENLEKCINDSIKGMFEWRGSVRKIIDEKIESVMIPLIQEHDYSKHIVKLDSVLTAVIDEVAKDNRTILENFKDLMASEKIEHMNLSDIFEKWCYQCASDIDTDKVDGMDFEGGYIDCSYEVENIENTWSSFERKRVSFVCEEDDSFNVEFEISRLKKSTEGGFDIENPYKYDSIRSLRYMDGIQILFLKLSQARCPIIVDNYNGSEDVFVEYRE